MQMKPGARLESATCATQVIVVKGSGDVDVRCGGVAMQAVGTAGDGHPVDVAYASGTLMGKRYGDDAAGIELLCTKPGEGSLSIGTEPLLEKSAKPLPSSD